LAVALLISVLYLAAAQNGVPPPGGPVGHALGIVGFVLMLGAETLYSWRKGQRGAGRGRISTWLGVHIFIGLIGPFLVLLHSAWRLNGLAGGVMILTMLMVASGFLCSYVYTAMPHTIDGADVELSDLEQQIAAANADLQNWKAGQPKTVASLGERMAALTVQTGRSDEFMVLGRSLLRWGYQRQLRQALGRVAAADQPQARALGSLLERRYRLQLQADSLAAARSLLGRSRQIHVLIGVVLFALAFVHIGVALYYATFAH
jgi:hypothetical protein